MPTPDFARYRGDIALFQQTASEKVIPYGKRDDIKMTVGSFAGAMADDMQVINHDGQQLVLTEEGFKGFVTGRLDLNWKTFQNPALTMLTRQAMINDVAAAHADDELLVRHHDNTIDTILSSGYSTIDNYDIVFQMMRLQLTGDIPAVDQLFLERFSLSPDRRRLHMRLIAPEVWNFDLGDDPYYGSVVISNNELGKGALTIDAAVQRLACINYSIGEPLVKVTHRWQNENDFIDALRTAMTDVTTAVGVMEQGLHRMKGLELGYPNQMLTKLIGDMGMSDKAAVEARDYFANEGGRNMYDAVQAVTHGVKEMSKTKSPTRWDRRVNIERQIWQSATAFCDMADEGVEIETQYLSPETKLKHMIADFLEGKADRQSVKGAQKALHEASQEVLVLDTSQ